VTPDIPKSNPPYESAEKQIFHISNVIMTTVINTVP
jgi:hypothetical protein